MAQGTTTLQFTIGVDGPPHNIVVYSTSGNVDLDQAAITCASTWRYKPAVKDGNPVAVLWRANVVWTYPTIISPVGYNRSAHQCAFAWSLVNARTDEVETVLSFRVDADGSVKALRISEPSADQQFDQALLKCVSSWTYTPATRNGVPVRVVWETRFHSAPKEGVWMLEGPLRPHYCSPSQYPLQALRNGAEGTTVLNFRIDEVGTLQQIVVTESSGNRDLDEASKACAAGWHYIPALKDNQAVAFPWSAQITWKGGQIIVAELGNGDEPP